MNLEKLNIEINEFSQKIKDVTIVVETNNNILITKLTGIIDTYNSTPLGSVLTKEFDMDYQTFVYDLGGISYMSSTGVGLFTSLLKDSRNKNKKIFISNLQQKVKEVYELLGFSNFFDIIDNINEISIERKHLFPVSLKCPQCSVSLKVPRPCRFSCKSCKHIFIINELGKLEIDRSQ